MFQAKLFNPQMTGEYVKQVKTIPFGVENGSMICEICEIVTRQHAPVSLPPRRQACKVIPCVGRSTDAHATTRK